MCDGHTAIHSDVCLASFLQKSVVVERRTDEIIERLSIAGFLSTFNTVS